MTQSAFPTHDKTEDGKGLELIDPGMSYRRYLVAHSPVTVQEAYLACGWGPDTMSLAEVLLSDTTRATLMAVWALMRLELADETIRQLENP